jgi:hypothetical protein
MGGVGPIGVVGEDTLDGTCIDWKVCVWTDPADEYPAGWSLGNE